MSTSRFANGRDPCAKLGVSCIDTMRAESRGDGDDVGCLRVCCSGLMDDAYDDMTRSKTVSCFEAFGCRPRGGNWLMSPVGIHLLENGAADGMPHPLQR